MLFQYYILVGLILFLIGLAGVLIRRNVVIVLMSLELMLNAINILLVVFAKFNNSVDGLAFVFFTITIAAAEVAVGLALIVSIYKKLKTIHLNEMNLMKN